jgi:SAM-dependent methyltransferase
VTTSLGPEEWDRRYADSELLWTAQPNRFLVAEAAGLTPGRALDVACGEGRNAVWLAEQGWRVTGVDFSEVGLAKARRLAAARGVDVAWVAADLLGYRPQPRAFDLVLVFYLQLPESERGPILHAAAEAVAAGGTLLVVAHDSSNLEHGHGGPRSPAVLYTPDDVVRDLDGSRFEIVRAEVVQRSVETPAGERAALDALVRARRTRRDDFATTRRART